LILPVSNTEYAGRAALDGYSALEQGLTAQLPEISPCFLP
jgi:hypothetical protein